MNILIKKCKIIFEYPTKNFSKISYVWDFMNFNFSHYTITLTIVNCNIY